MSDSPLPPCRSTLNCYRTSRVYAQPPDALFDVAAHAVDTLSGFTIGRATEVERDPEIRWMSADFRVFLFTDDLDLQVEAYEDRSVLYVRSASRVGRSDLGTNRRRVEALLECIGDALGD